MVERGELRTVDVTAAARDVRAARLRWGRPDDRRPRARHHDPHRARPAGRSGRQPGPPGRQAEGDRRVRLLLRPVAGRHAVGRHAAQPAPAGPAHRDRHQRRRWPSPGSPPCSPTRTCPARKTYGLEHKDQPVLAWDQVRYQGEPVALVAADHPETARRAAARIEVDYEVLPPVTDARAALDPDAPALHEGGNLVRHVRIRKGHPDTRRRRRGPRRVPGRHAGPGVPRPRVGPGRARRGRRRRPVRGHPVAARGPGPGRGQPRPARRQGADHPVRRRRGVRRPRGPVHADPRLPARAAHRQAGQDGVLPGGVVLRARAPAPGLAALRARQHGGRAAGLRQGRHRAGRRRVRVELARGRGQRGDPRHRPVRGAARRDGLLRGLHQQPAVRRDARVRRGAGLLRVRDPDGQAGRRAGPGPGGAPDPQRDAGGIGDADRPGGGLGRPGGRDLEAGRVPAAAARRPGRAGRGRGPAHAAGRGVQHDPRRRRRPRRRLRGRHQERLLLRGLRRLLHGPGAARAGRRRAGRAGADGRRRGRAGPGHRAGPDRPDRARRAARGHPARRHLDRQRRFLLGVPADLRDRRRGPGRVPGGTGAAGPPGAGALRGPGPRPGRPRPSWPSCSTSRPSRR